jgi:hypothetical protein
MEFIWRLVKVEGLNWGLAEAAPSAEKSTIEIAPATAMPRPGLVPIKQ